MFDIFSYIACFKWVDRFEEINIKLVNFLNLQYKFECLLFLFFEYFWYRSEPMLNVFFVLRQDGIKIWYQRMKNI